MEKKNKPYTITIRAKDHPLLNVTLTLDPMYAIEDKLSTMEKFEQVEDYLKKFMLDGKN
jgi:hypothetical protein